ncbi:hypothetical protein V5O48_004236 [Marasmius crinis-equi]|uniref:C2H2-type domain-containing protein n=1 Tax=Marasmius crinis-equi TaxID=585013 RepID=A0ABR3FQL8_9AGAR
MLTSKSTITTPSSTILGKRKATSNPEYVLHLVSSPEPPGATDSEFEPSEPEPSSKKQRVALNDSKPILLNGKLATCDTKKRYACTYDGCTKAYTKPSRLEEHERSHTGFCKGRKFASQKGLRAHQKLHEQREVEAALNVSDVEDGDTRPRKKRRGGEIGRDWRCEVEGCGKDFKSSKALGTHHKVTHLGRRDFVCPHGDCQATFGYKHLLQRHLTKIHPHCSSSGASDSNDESQSDGSDDSSPDDEVSDPEPRPRKEKATMDMSIDAITGLNYAAQARQKLKGFKALSCPFPNLDQILRSSQAETGASSASSSRASSCDYVFSRAYDLRRHLRAQHGTEADKSSIEEWVARRKASLRAS